MKKTLIALAAVAATGAAMAQSSVTIYGVVDVGFTSVNNSGVGSTDNTGLTSSNMTTNRLGFRGTEDLGGGLKANFQVETSLAADAPAASSIGDRGAWVGLSGGFGEIRLGREYSTTFWSGFLFSPFGTGGVGNGFGFANRVVAHAVTGQTNPIWNNNSITYTSPRMSGFMVQGQYVFDEVAGANNAGRSAGIRFNYSGGPLGAELAFSDTDGGATVAATTLLGLTTSAAHKSVVGGVSYDFGVAKLKGTIANGKVTTDAQPDVKINEYEIGLDVPVTTALSVSVGYGQSKQKIAGVLDAKTSGYGVTALYTLSKRTAVYAGLATASEKDGAGVKTDKATKYGVGIRHNF